MARAIVGCATEWPHPVLTLALLGDDLLPGVMKAADEAVHHYMEATGGTAVLFRIPNCCYIPHFGLGHMRNWGLAQGYLLGADYMALLESDVLLSDSAVLCRMANSGKPITVPFYDQSRLGLDNECRISHPQFIREGGKPNIIGWSFDGNDGHIAGPPGKLVVDQMGRQVRLEWCVFSCIMFTRDAYEQLNCLPFSPVPIIRNEEYHAAIWKTKGVHMWLDFAATVELLRPTTRTEAVVASIQSPPMRPVDKIPNVVRLHKYA